MSSRNMKLDEIKARAQEAFQKAEERKRDAMLAWRAQEDEASQRRVKTEKLKAQRLAKEAEDLAAMPPPVEKKTRSRAVKAEVAKPVKAKVVKAKTVKAVKVAKDAAPAVS